MDFPLNAVLTSSLVAGERFSNGFRSLYSMLANDVLYPDPNELVIFGDNHDMRRIYGQLGEDYQLFELAMAYLATMRGAPQIYYGTEILTSSGRDHGIIRSDFPGGWGGRLRRCRLRKGADGGATAGTGPGEHALQLAQGLAGGCIAADSPISCRRTASTFISATWKKKR